MEPKEKQKKTQTEAQSPLVVAAEDHRSFLASIVESSDDAIVGKTPEGVITSWNPAAERMYGYAAPEVVGKHISMLLPPDRPKEMEDILAKIRKGERVEHYETLRVRKDGSTIHVSLTVSPIHDAAGRLIGVSSIKRDITERKRAEEQFQATSQYVRSLIESSLDPLVTISPEGKITDVNEATIKVTGMRREKLVGTDFSDYFTEPENARTGYMQVFSKGSVTDYPLTIRHKDGRLMDVLYNASLYRDMQGNVLGVFAAARDVTAQKQAAQYSRSLIEASLDPLVTISPEGKITDVNEATIKVTGRQREELIGTDFLRIETPLALESALDSKSWDAVISDYNLPSFTGLDALRTIRARGLDLPFILVSGVIGEEKAVEAMKAGAHDYIMKGNYPRLAPALERELGDAAVRSERLRAEEELRLAHAELERRVAERTAELKAANTLLRDSRLAALNMMEDALAARKQAEEASAELQNEALERKQTEEALRESERRYSALFANKINGMAHCRIITDEHGRPVDYRILQINEAYERIIGIKKADIEGRRVKEIFPDIENYAVDYIGIFGKIALEGGEIMFEEFFEATRQYLSIYAYSPLPGEFAAILTDVTERKRAEAALKRAYDEMEKRVEERTAELRDKDQILLLQSRQAAMGEMIGNIAHQWRQPLNTLGLTIQRQLLFYDLGNFNREILEKDVSSSMEVIKHMSRTIDDFRNYFRPDKEKIEFRVHDAIVNTLSLLEGTLQNPQIGIAIVAKDNPVIYGYQNEFAQALLNILMNARDALLEREIADPRVTITIYSEDGCVVVTVADNAGGIPEEIIGKIFDPYFTTKGPQQGTGVGLFMSKAIIEKNMGGKLAVRNIVDGAEFRIEVCDGIRI